MEKLMDFLAMENYLGLISATTSSICFVFSIKYRGKHQEYRYSTLYFGTYTLIKLFAYINFGLLEYSDKVLFYVPIFLDFVFTIMEFFILLSLIDKSTPNIKSLLNVEKCIFICFVSAIFFKDLFFNSELTFQTLNLTYTVQAILLISASLCYFIRLLNNDSSQIDKDPNFWAISGIMLFMVCTLPVSLFCNYLNQRNAMLGISLFSIFYFFYIILFCLILKAQIMNFNQTPKEI